MVMVIVILWRRLDASITMIQNIQAAHYETMIERAARDTEEKHRLADNLEKHAEAMRALRETLVLINDRVGHRV
jgi:hypothetical protein